MEPDESARAQLQHAMALRANAQHRMMVGGVWFGIGIVITIVTYAAADPGGTFIIAYGPAIFGAIHTARAFFDWFAADGMVSRLSGPARAFNNATPNARPYDHPVPQTPAQPVDEGVGFASPLNTPSAEERFAPPGGFATPVAQGFEAPVAQGQVMTMTAVGTAVFAEGAVAVKNPRSLAERTSLLAPELDLWAQAAEWGAALEQRYGGPALGQWGTVAATATALPLIRRYATHEGSRIDTADMLGAPSAQRIGGVLGESVASRPDIAEDVVRAVERTVQASYLAMLLTAPEIAGRARNEDPRQVWDRWMQLRHAVPEHVLDPIVDLCAFLPFWGAALQKWGLANHVEDSKDPSSPIAHSLSALCGVGAALAYAERQ